MPTLVETREQHRERITRALTELERFCARRDDFLARIDWQAMTSADREQVEDFDLDLAMCAHELGCEMASIWRGDHGIF